jgi:hypothetical protein
MYRYEDIYIYIYIYTYTYIYTFARFGGWGVPADTPSEYGACPSHLAAEEGHPRVLEVR